MNWQSDKERGCCDPIEEYRDYLGSRRRERSGVPMLAAVALFLAAAVAVAIVVALAYRHPAHAQDRAADRKWFVSLHVAGHDYLVLARGRSRLDALVNAVRPTVWTPAEWQSASNIDVRYDTAARGVSGPSNLLAVSHLHYQLMTIEEFDTKPADALPTRVELGGVLVYKATEQDGDTHMWICDELKYPSAELKPGAYPRRHCAVAEVMPDLPVPFAVQVRVGSLVRVFGISRLDGEHKWRELHPVERMVAEVK